MKILKELIPLLLLLLLIACARPTETAVDDTADQECHTDTAFDTDLRLLQMWIAGEIVDSAAVDIYGIDRCFVIEEISDSIFAVIDGVSYQKNSPVRRENLRYLKVLHYDADGKIRLGEMICNKAIAETLTEIFRTLYDAHYPIAKMTLIDNYGGDDEASMADNNTSCYNCRIIHGGRRLSQHAYGMAVDINPLYNPYVKTVNGHVTDVAPAAAARYAERDSSRYMIRKGDACHRAFADHGFTWGGSWKRSVKDYQHFQKTVR